MRLDSNFWFKLQHLDDGDPLCWSVNCPKRYLRCLKNSLLLTVPTSTEKTQIHPLPFSHKRVRSSLKFNKTISGIGQTVKLQLSPMSRRHKTSLSVCELENSDGNGGEKTGGVEAIELPLALRVAFVNLLAEGDEVGLAEVSISLVHCTNTLLLYNTLQYTNSIS